MGTLEHNSLLRLLFSAGVMAITAQHAHANGFGVEVTGQATVSYSDGQSRIINPTNQVSFVVVPPQVTPEVGFFRHAPTTFQTQVQILGSDYSLSGQLEGPFSAVDRQPIIDSGIDLSAPVPLAPATSYVPGELLFVELNYITANTDSFVAETYSIVIEGESGDWDVLRLYESGPDTGKFWGYIPISTDAVLENDGQMSVEDDAKISVIVEDTRRSVVLSQAEIAASPINFVFDSITGAPISGAEIQILDRRTRKPAVVFGVDQRSIFPNRVTSGETVQDESGLRYDSQTGVFCFPFLPVGEYVIEVKPPEGYAFASGLSPETILQSVQGSYVLEGGSFGLPYEVSQAGPLEFDIPLDPISDLNLSISSDSQSADVGDLVHYSVTVQNLGTATVPLMLENSIPKGFKYLPSSTTMENANVSDPYVGLSGQNLSFSMGLIDPQETLTLIYSTVVGPGAQIGKAINSGVMLNGAGEAVSNRSSHSLTIQDDLLRSRSTIIGKVAAEKNKTHLDTPESDADTSGIEGIRIYMETGAYAITDADGLFHFEGVKTGTHVVQIDEQTLPEGYEVVPQERTTRFAGSKTSQFIDVQGGGVWRANFYLRQVAAQINDAKGNESLQDLETPKAPESSYLNYDESWLSTQTDEAEWVYPNPTTTPAKPSINLGIKHPVGAKVSLSLNGQVVNRKNLVARDTDPERRVMISRWKGVDILDGRNQFSATVTAPDGSTIEIIDQTVFYVSKIARASIMTEQSNPIADGRTPPSIAIRLEDEAGRPVHAGREAKITIDAPYQFALDDKQRTMAVADFASGIETRQFVGHDGVIRLKLEPTQETGKLTARVTLDNGRVVPVHIYMQPEKRDWIVVGLATGSVMHEKLSDNMVPVNLDQKSLSSDGRVAFFAKGVVKGEWLLTMSLDTDRRRGSRDQGFLTEVDPNAYYTLYGSRSDQTFDGTSRYPLFVKLERKTAYALFGDFTTDATDSKLSVYNRQLSGLKAGYQGKKIQAQAFAAETNQGFAKDELPADGTSGIYRLSQQNVLAQSEKIIIETRDRIRPDIVLERRELTRFVDYTLDYLSGELIFKFPIDVSDADFNPNVIVVDYETSEDAERNITLGGRVQAQALAGKLRVGVTGISENGSTQSAGAKTVLVGFDATAQITKNTELRVEYAASNDALTGETDDAKLAEIIHTSDKMSAEAYFREEGAGFGVGQTNSNTSSIRRFGGRAEYRFSEFITQKTGRRGLNTVQAAAYREDNLSTGDSRDTGEVSFTRKTDRLSLTAGLRASQDKLVDQVDRQSVLALSQMSYAVPKIGVNLQVSHEQPFSGKDDVSALPQRTKIGIDKTLGSKATVNLRHEILKGETTDAQNTSIGLTLSPWKGSVLTGESDMVTQDSTRRLGATLGLDQQIRLSDKWSASTGLRNRRILEQGGDYVEVTPDAAVSPLETSENFSSGYVGVGYRGDKTVAALRAEAKSASSGETVIGTVSVAREITEALSLAGSSRYVTSAPNDGSGSSKQMDVRLGAAWRPRDEGLAFFNRLDLAKSSGGLTPSRAKIVNNFAANKKMNNRWQLSFNHGIKHVSENLADTKFKSLTNLVGVETRFDITPKIDLGLRGSALVSDQGQAQYSYGPSIGASPVKNVWVSLGYNVDGYSDDDFAAAEYSRKGVYVNLRFKFDQNSLKGLLGRISPNSAAAAR